MDLPGQLCQRRGLAKRLPSAEGHPFEQRVLPHLLQEAVRIHHITALEIVRLGIVAAGAVVRASLRKDHIADALAVHNGLRHDATNS